MSDELYRLCNDDLQASKDMVELATIQKGCYAERQGVKESAIMKATENSRTDRRGVHIVGEQFEKAGYAFREQPTSDYGIDAQVELVEEGNATGKLIALQIKSGPSWFREKNDEGFVFRGEKEHLDYWLDHSLPVLVVLCDIAKGKSYWQAITPSSVIPTGKKWKTLVPKRQQINPGMDVDLRRLVNKVAVYENYTVVRTEDVSHGTAKRYSLRIVLHREHTQFEILELIGNVTYDAINCEYHRSDAARHRWRGRPAHVVWLFVYPSAVDEKNNNFICQSEWFSDTLALEFRPNSNGGEEFFPGIKVVWKDDYLAMSKFYSENTMTSKEDFKLQVCELVEQTKPLIGEAEQVLDRHQSGQLSFEGLKTKWAENFSKMDEIYRVADTLNNPPYECRGVDDKFQIMIAYAHNIYLLPGERSGQLDENNTILNIKSQIKYYHEALPKLEFELKKMR